MRARRSTRRFRAGVGGALRRKEWLLLRRDPWLGSQLMLQMSLHAAHWRRTVAKPRARRLARARRVPDARRHHIANLSLARLARGLKRGRARLSGDGAGRATGGDGPPNLRRSRRRSSSSSSRRFVVFRLVRSRFRRRRRSSWRCIACASTALLNIWRPCLGKRSDLLRRHQQSKLVGAVEHLLALSWAVVMAMIVAGSALALAPFGLDRAHPRAGAAAGEASGAFAPAGCGGAGLAPPCQDRSVAPEPAALYAAPPSANPGPTRSMPLTHRPVAAGDHVFLVDGSSFVFRAYFQSIRQDQKYNMRLDRLPVGAVRLFCVKLFQFIREGAAGGDADPSRHHLRQIRGLVPQGALSALQGQSQRAAGRPHSAVPADARGGARLRPHPDRAGPLRGRRPHRHLCETSRRARRRRAHRLRRQGPDAAHRPARVDV